MAVFTNVSLDELKNWISQFSLGQAHAIKGIASGIENTNYFIHTDQGEFVLTIFENLSFEQLPFYLKLMRHLADGGILVPAPIANLQGELISTLHGKPAAIVSKLNGSSEMQPQTQHCAQVGEMLARMHVVGQSFPIVQANLRAFDWWQATAPQVREFLDVEQLALLNSEMQAQTQLHVQTDYASLPRGPIHADLFRNNVMFSENKLGGFFDFYFAGCDTFIFDIAVTVNDWCIDLETGALDIERCAAMLDAYQKVRALTSEERAVWPMMLRGAALRFWLSRLYDFYKPREAEVLTPHDPRHFERILQQRRCEINLALN
jgi:homoserine kinase type II